MLLVVISDLHLGRGRYFKNGHLNFLEDFEEDERFAEFVEFYCTSEYEKESVNLILNGDVFNLIQIEVKGVFTHLITEGRTIEALESIIEGHPLFFNALKKFLTFPNKKLTYVIGNHDSGMYWNGPQNYLQKYLQGKIHFCMNYFEYGVYIEHGHRFEVINTVAPHKYFAKGPNGEEVLNLPWGSLFCVVILPILKKERPFLDKVRPISLYIRWCFLHDFFYFLRMAKLLIFFFMQFGITKLKQDGKSILTSLLLLRHLTIYPRYEKQAKRILRRNPLIHTVILGHTHLTEWRKFPENKYYFNTGTWNIITSVDSGLHQDEPHLTYVAIKINETSGLVESSGLYYWNGHWRPYRERIQMGPYRNKIND